jgi:hypothetical protein
MFGGQCSSYCCRRLPKGLRSFVVQLCSSKRTLLSCSFVNAGLAMHRHTQHGSDRIRGMHRIFNLERAPAVRKPIPLETFRAGIADALKKEGTLKLLQAKQDHNVCPECKSESLSAASTWVNLERARMCSLCSSKRRLSFVVRGPLEIVA